MFVSVRLCGGFYHGVARSFREFSGSVLYTVRLYDEYSSIPIHYTFNTIFQAFNVEVEEHAVA